MEGLVFKQWPSVYDRFHKYNIHLELVDGGINISGAAPFDVFTYERFYSWEALKGVKLERCIELFMSYFIFEYTEELERRRKHGKE